MIKRIVLICTAVIIASVMCLTVFAKTPRAVDNAGLLTSSELRELQSLLDEISERHLVDVAVLTENGTGGFMSTREYAEYFFEQNYGYGDELDGVIFFVNMSEREWHIATSGYAITAITDYGLAEIEDETVGYLSAGQYYRAFEKYADMCDEFITSAKSGHIYDVYDEPSYGVRRRSIFSMSNVIISLVFGCIVSLVTVSSMKSQLKTVRMQPNASAYERKNSFNVTNSRDIYLYRRVSKTPRPQDPPPQSRSFSGGSTTHMSSSGHSFGGRGGKF